jgi:colicin import membrane protein
LVNKERKSGNEATKEKNVVKTSEDK